MRVERVVPVIYVDRPREVLGFYTDCLGFKIDTAHPTLDEPDLVILDHGHHSLMICKVGPMPKSSSQINLEVDEFDSVLAALPNDVRPEWGPETFDYGRREVGLRDPSGVLVVLSMRGVK